MEIGELKKAGKEQHEITYIAEIDSKKHYVHWLENFQNNKSIKHT